MSKHNIPQNIKVELPSSPVEKPARSLEEIQQEFTSVCAKAGHCQYTITSAQRDLDMFNEQLRGLNLEAAASQVKAAKSE